MRKRYYIYKCFTTKEKMNELQNHLSINGYDFSTSGMSISVYEEEMDYVETIMDDRNINYFVEDVEWK